MNDARPTTRLATRKRVAFDVLTDPRRWDHEQTPYDAEVLFGLVHWLMREAARRARRGAPIYPNAPQELAGFGHERLWGNALRVTPARWRKDLREFFASGRFLSSVHARFRAVMAARGLCPGRSAMVPTPHVVFADGYCKGDPLRHDARVVRLADYVQRTLAVSHNEFHPTAVSVQEVTLLVGADGYSLSVNYGIPDDGSTWLVPRDGNDDLDHNDGRAVGPIAGESFDAFLDRAHASMEKLLRPSNEVPWSVYTLRHAEENDARLAVAYVLAPTPACAIAHGVSQLLGGRGMPLAVVDPRPGTACYLPENALSRVCALTLHGCNKARHDFAPWHMMPEVTATLLKLARAPWRSSIARWEGTEP